MGQNSFKSLTPPLFGIKTTNVVFRLFSKAQHAKKISEYAQYLLLHNMARHHQFLQSISYNFN